ncbi:MAG: alpha/beta fold hydrolase [Actinomycetota bacterium]
MPLCAHGDLNIYYETYGSPTDPTLVLINGLSNQCIHYRVELVAKFVEAGFHVIRFDNRDVGLSSDGPDGYGLSDMAHDVLALIDHLGLEHVHVFGVSLGGMIAQTFAIDHPNRCASLISVMSTTGDPDVGRPTEEARVLLLTPGATTREAAIAAHLAGQRVWGSPGFVDEELQGRIAGEAFDRACRPAGVARQYQAARRDGSRSDRLRRVTSPTLVLHGTADTLIDISGGRRTAEVIPRSRLVEIPGMGHDYPEVFWPVLVGETAAHALGS